MKFTVGKEFADIQAALEYGAANGAKNLEISLVPGIYRLEAPVVISSAMGFDSVTITGENRDTTVLCGSAALKVNWEHYEGGIFRAKVEQEMDMLYINGKQYHMARYPKFDESIRICQGYAADCISPERVARWRNPEGGYLHAIHRNRWGDFHYRIAGKDANGELILEGGTQNNRRLGLHDEYRYVENIFEELSAPGEWFHDRKTGMLYVYFRKEDIPDQSLVEAVTGEELVKVIGCENVTLRNLTFRHTCRTFMKVDEPLLRSDWCIYRGGALYFENTRNCRVEGCRLEDMGSNAVCVNGWNRFFTMESCLVRDIAGNGICFIGKTECVRSPLFEYAQRQHIRDVDLEPGPRSEDYPEDCAVTDCLITRTGRVEKQTAAVQISMSHRIRIANCTSHELPRAGINISEGCFGGHTIENCDVFDTVRETGDHGSFNSWGRDRFWELGGVDADNLESQGLAHLPYLDAVDTTVIRHNRMRCDWGWDIDLDDGSSNYEIHDNLCLNGGIKLREGFGRKVYNNITVNNGLHAHAWYGGSADRVWGNIFFAPYSIYKMPEVWGSRIDGNILYCEESGPAEALAAVSGQDSGSVAADCRFRDPAHGDYTVGEPAVLAMGFRNFSMTDFGVVSPWLRTLAKSPALPAAVAFVASEKENARIYSAGGAAFREIESMEEASAYGACSTDGVRVDGLLVCRLEPSCELTSRGLKAGDILLEINGRLLRSVEDLKDFAAILGDPAGADLKILRAQIEMKI